MSFELGPDIGYTFDIEHSDGQQVWVVSARDDQIFALGMPGSAIWLESLGASSLQDLIEGLSQEYGWSPCDIESDVSNFVNDLIARGWLKENVNP